MKLIPREAMKPESLDFGGTSNTSLGDVIAINQHPGLLEPLLWTSEFYKEGPDVLNSAPGPLLSQGKVEHCD